MEARGEVSDKQQLIATLEKVYKNACSSQDFYKKLQHKNIELYSRNHKIVGVKLKRKFRFATLGYTKTILQDLDRSPTLTKRMEALKNIRKHQKQQSKGLERTRKRGKFPR